MAEGSNSSELNRCTIEIPREKTSLLENFVTSHGGNIINAESNVEVNSAQDLEDPPNIATETRKWLKTHGVSVAVFAKEVVNRSQGTVSSLLGNPPSSFPRGTGNEPWHKMRTFLTNNALQEQLLAAAAKDKRSKTNAGKSTDDPPEKKSRKVFDKAQLASLDTIYKASNGRPSASMIDGIVKTMNLEKDQVANWFQNHRRLERNGSYKPGQHMPAGE